MRTVMFVCTGNCCRSPMAEGLFRKMLNENSIKGIRVVSAGTNPLDGSPPSKEGVICLKEYGVDISEHRAVHLGSDLTGKADLVFAMGVKNKDRVIELDPGARDKTFLLKEFAGDTGDPEIADPIGQPASVYERCALEINSVLRKAFPKILRTLGVQ